MFVSLAKEQSITLDNGPALTKYWTDVASLLCMRQLLFDHYRALYH